MWNRHRESKNTKLYEIGSGTKLFITFELKGYSTWEERDTIFLCWLLLHRQLSTQPTRSARSAQSRLASPSWISTLSFGGRNSTLLFLKSQPTLPVHDVTHIPWYNSYLGFLCWHLHILSARAWTPALMLHLTNPCAKRKVLCLTKPKGKIYKTKSLRHDITLPFRARVTWNYGNKGVLYISQSSRTGPLPSNAV